MLVPRRGCLGYSKVYCDVRKRVPGMEPKQTYYVLHIPCLVY